MRVAFDLTDVADKLARTPRFKPVVGAIRKFRSAWSIWVDLKSAERALEIISEIEDSDGMREDLSGPLMTHAVLMYCRGVVSEQRGRNTVEVKQAFSDEQKLKHEAIASLRNTVIAHFDHPRGPYAERWSTERVVTRVLEDNSSGTFFVYNRANYLMDASNDLYELLGVVMPIVWSAIESRRSVMDEKIAQHVGDAEFLQVLKECRFIPEAFYDRPDAVDEFWRPRDGAYFQIFEFLRQRHQTDA